MITFDGVTKRYPDGTVAVDDLTLEVPTGTLTVFVGPSGCGKTTSMRMINRMIEPTSGTLTVDGRDVSTVNPVKLRLGIGYVIQSGGLMPHQRVVDNVATVPVLTGQSRREARKAAYAVLERVGLDPKLGDRYPAQLSGGQQQRVGVARALAADPDPADGRTVLGRRPGGARRVAGRNAAPARRTAQDHRLRHPRHRRGDQARRPSGRVRTGGALQQYDEPARLLSNPANDFVAGFIGADRGYRGLQFYHATGVPLHDVRAVTEPGDRRPGARSGRVGAHNPSRRVAICVDQRGRRCAAPQRQLALRQHHRRRVAVPPDGTLRQALDAALSSPSALGVAVDASGRVAGGVRAEDVLEASSDNAER